MLITVREIQAFHHDPQTGVRRQVVLPKGTRVYQPEVDRYDPIYGEPVVWMRARLDGVWTVVGGRNLPVLKAGWQAEYLMALTYEESARELGMSLSQARALCRIAGRLLGRSVTCWDIVHAHTS